MSTALPLLPWQDKPWATVSSARERGALNHAWLLAGPEGVGKRHFAAALAASLLCASPLADQHACGDCRSCKMLANGGHPDAHLLSREGHVGLASHHSLQAEKGLSFWLPKPTSMRAAANCGNVAASPQNIVAALQIAQASDRIVTRFARSAIHPTGTAMKP